MNIICKNIDDFCTMITTCCANNIKDIRVFISEKESYPNVSVGTSKNHISFTYALFTPLYTAIYSENILNSKYDSIYKTLLDCQEQCNCDFRIQVFNSIKYKDNNLYIERELDVI